MFARTKNFVVLIFISTNTALILFSSCQKQTHGCQDALANNNCHGCNLNDQETCEFEGTGVFWYQGVVADSLNHAGMDSAFFYIDGEFAGSSRVYHQNWIVFPWGGFLEPVCGEDSTVTIIRTWKSDSKHVFNYRVDDEHGATRWNGSQEFEANQCKKIQLHF